MVKKIRLTQDRIASTIKEAVGEDALPIVKYLQGKKNISDFKIAEVTKLDIHEVRNVLYRLFNNNLVSYYRKKDRQKGWYISYWTFNRDRVRDLIITLTKRKLEKFKERLQEEEENQGKIYMSPSASIRVTFEEAVDLEFRCPETGELLVPVDNQRTIDFLREQIKKLEDGEKASV